MPEGITMKRLCISGLLFALSGMSALACSFDTDCQVGSRCIKGAGALYGICAGGLFPGNGNDRVPSVIRSISIALSATRVLSTSIAEFSTSA